MPTLGLGKRTKPLMAPDEVRRLPDDEQIIFLKNLPPIRALKAGYQEISPWRKVVAANPLHGGKQFLGRVKLKIKGGSAAATRFGTRMVIRAKRPLLRPLFAALGLLLPSKQAVGPAALVVVILTLGLPHLRVQYTASHSWCRYVGLPVVSQSFETYGHDNCPFIIWKKLGETQS